MRSHDEGWISQGREIPQELIGKFTGLRFKRDRKGTQSQLVRKSGSTSSCIKQIRNERANFRIRNDAAPQRAAQVAHFR